VLLGLAWFAMLIAAMAPLERALRRPATLQALDRLTGGLFLLFGAKLALSRD
jgi:threonine/homoserine/homoserine lactone efflux protein